MNTFPLFPSPYHRFARPQQALFVPVIDAIRSDDPAAARHATFLTLEYPCIHPSTLLSSFSFHLLFNLALLVAPSSSPYCSASFLDFISFIRSVSDKQRFTKEAPQNVAPNIHRFLPHLKGKEAAYLLDPLARVYFANVSILSSCFLPGILSPFILIGFFSPVSYNFILLFIFIFIFILFLIFILIKIDMHSHRTESGQ